MTITPGLDIGYNAVKAVSGKLQVTFPSVVGTADTARFALNATKDVVIEHNGNSYLVGESAISQSRMVQRREDRHWFESDEYTILLLAALAALNVKGDVSIVTGLPVAFFVADKEKLQAKIMGEYTFTRNGVKFSVNVTAVKVVPQPFGTLLDIALDADGDVIDAETANGNIGIIDCGGKTTNLLSVKQLGDISKETKSADIGGWDIVRALSDYMDNEYPNRNFKDHELAEIIRTGKFTYFGNKIDVRNKISEIIGPLANEIISKASQYWNGGAAMDKIIVTGGGAHLLGKAILAHFPHAVQHINPVFGNASGYAKLGAYNANKQR